MNPWPDLRPILQGIDWVIIGGVATRAYMPERMTKDLYILVHRDDADEVIAKLKKAGYRMDSQLAIPGYSMVSPEGVEVDVISGEWLAQRGVDSPGKRPGWISSDWDALFYPFEDDRPTRTGLG